MPSPSWVMRSKGAALYASKSIVLFKKHIKLMYKPASVPCDLIHSAPCDGYPGIGDFWERWRSVCAEVAKCECFEKALWRINGFLDRMADAFLRGRVNVRTFMEALVRMEVIRNVWGAVRSREAPAAVLEPCYYFLAKMTFVSKDLASGLLEEDFVGMITCCLKECDCEIPQKWMIYAVRALMNLIGSCALRPETLNMLVNAFPDLAQKWTCWRIDEYEIIRLGCVLAPHERMPNVQAWFLRSFRDHVTYDTYGLVACCLYQMLSKNYCVDSPELAQVLEKLLKMQKGQDGISEIGSEAASLVLSVTRIVMEYTHSPSVRQAISISVPVHVLRANLEGENPTLFVTSIALMTSSIPGDLLPRLCQFYMNSITIFHETIVAPKLVDGTHREKVGCLTFVQRAIDYYPGLRTSLLLDADLLGTYADIFYGLETQSCECLLAILINLMTDNGKNATERIQFMQMFFDSDELVNSLHDLMDGSHPNISKQCETLLMIGNSLTRNN